MTLYLRTLVHSILGRDISLFLFLHLSPPLQLNYLNSSNLIFKKNVKERIAQRISDSEQ